MLYPSNWKLDEKIKGEYTAVARLLQQAQKSYAVKLQPLDALVENAAERNMWAEPYTNLLGFNMTEFDRVVAIDSSSMVRHNLDELFLIPSTPLAMPYVYFGEPDGWQFSSQLMIITPSKQSFARISEAVNGSQFMEHDTAILERLFYGQIIKIPQRPFALMSGEYRRASHDRYIGNRFPKVWDPDRILSEARILHFSDYPLPKPWEMASREMLNRHMPQCKSSEFGATDCKDREVWTDIYREYRNKRETVCGAEFGAVLKEGPLDEESARARMRILHVE
jgi:alpha-N-acetylglucosamine transferase